IGVLRPLIETKNVKQAFRHAVLIDIDNHINRIAKKEPALSRSLHQIGDVIPPGDIAGPNHTRNEKKDALHPMRAQDRESYLVVVQVAVVEGDQDPATADLLIDRAVDKGERLFQIDQRDVTLQAGNLFTQLLRGRRAYTRGEG